MFLGRRLLCILSVFLCTPLVCAQSKPETLNLTFTTIDVPGAMNTVVTDINSAGVMVGYSYNAPFAVDSTGFLLSGGNFTSFTYPGANATQALGINDAGLISGTAYYSQNSKSLGFTYDGTTFTVIQVANRVFTIVSGIDNAGDVVGGDGNGSDTIKQAFKHTGSLFRDVTPPPGGWTSAVAYGINNHREIVGTTVLGTQSSGFAFNRGTFQTIIVPGTRFTGAVGVNDNGIIVGWYRTPFTLPAFALKNGKYVSLQVPGAKATSAYGISVSGQIVGSYTYDFLTYHGFVTSPITDADFQ